MFRPISTKLLPSLNAGKFDVVMSTLNHTPERAKLVDFVDYMSASEGILVRKGSTIHANGYAGLCGTSLNVVGTTSLEASARAANKRCARKIKIITQSNTPTAVNAFLGGSGDAYLGDLPVVAHYVKMYPGRLREAGKPIPTGQNYGIAYPKNKPALGAALQGALSALMHNGTYLRILHKWDLANVALKG